MTHASRLMSALVVVLAGIGAATAAEMSSGDQPATAASSAGSKSRPKINLTPAQKQTILRDLATESAEPAAAPVQATVGSRIPTSIALHPLPMAVATDVPSAKNFSYAKLRDNDIVIVDPKDRVVADIIPAGSSTTGSGSPGQ